MNDINIDIFTEQAEHIEDALFKKWTISHLDEVTIIKKLTQGGAKLITGPRGCGKTTLLIKAYNKSASKKATMPLPIYVNFKSSLKLEPLYRNNSNAAYWFNQWLLLKVLAGLQETLNKLGFDDRIRNSNLPHIEKNINLLEMGRVDLLDDANDMLSISLLKNIIDESLETTGKNRCVLLLDDAGHAFSSEQQHDFFEFFREIKTKVISPKAAIYPGVTSYSSSFHVGHDAEEIDVWVKPNSSDYMKFMHSLLESRLGEKTYSKLTKEKRLLDLMCYSAYGIPRALLNMISGLYRAEDENGQSELKFNNKAVMREIKNSFNKTYQIYDSLKLKLPMYKNFIDIGSTFYDKCLILNKDFNKKEDIKKQSSMIAIKRPISPELSKVIGFFQYAGLMAPFDISSRGGKGVYELYELHYGAIIDRNVFFSSRGISVENYCIAFENRPNHHYPRHTEQSVLETEDIHYNFKLALPPCEFCQTPRVSNEARFCSNCGQKLKDASIFENIVNQDIDCLPITGTRAQSIKEESNLRLIKDILMDYDNSGLRSVRMIGPIWAKRIRFYAEEYIA